MLLFENRALLVDKGGPSWSLPKNSDRRLPYAEWGMWSEPLSTVTGIESGERVKAGLIREFRSTESAIFGRVTYPAQDQARW